jgi:hypothetical protein
LLERLEELCVKHNGVKGEAKVLGFTNSKTPPKAYGVQSYMEENEHVDNGLGSTELFWVYITSGDGKWLFVATTLTPHEIITVQGSVKSQLPIPAKNGEFNLRCMFELK